MIVFIIFAVDVAETVEDVVGQRIGRPGGSRCQWVPCEVTTKTNLILIDLRQVVECELILFVIVTTIAMHRMRTDLENGGELWPSGDWRWPALASSSTAKSQSAKSA